MAFSYGCRGRMVTAGRQWGFPPLMALRELVPLRVKSCAIEPQFVGFYDRGPLTTKMGKTPRLRC
jgi:hypothetical protein